MQEERPTEGEIAQKIAVLNDTRERRNHPDRDRSVPAWDEFHDALAWLMSHGAPMDYDPETGQWHFKER